MCEADLAGFGCAARGITGKLLQKTVGLIIKGPHCCGFLMLVGISECLRHPCVTMELRFWLSLPCASCGNEELEPLPSADQE